MKISVRDLHFAYPNRVRALRGVSLDIVSGEVIIGDRDTRTHTAAQMARHIGLVFQNPDEQIFKSRVADEIAFGPRNLRLAPTEVDRRVAAALERTGLVRVRDTHPYELMPVERKWVALASVLALETSILVLDEPMTGQDARRMARLGALVEELASAGKTIVLVTHDIDFCAEHFERVVVMGQGRVMMDGAKHQVLSRSQVLAETFVEPPQVTRLGLALDLPAPVMTVEELLRGYEIAAARRQP